MAYVKKGSTKGRKPRLTHYEPGKLGLRGFSIGQRCEVLWREAWKDHWRGQPRPKARKQIIALVAEEFGETPAMVERLWKEYRRAERDLRRDADKNSGS